jgi:hypothetical protein
VLRAVVHAIRTATHGDRHDTIWRESCRAFRACDDDRIEPCSSEKAMPSKTPARPPRWSAPSATPAIADDQNVAGARQNHRRVSYAQDRTPGRRRA